MLEVQNLDTFYGEFQVLRDVSIRVEKGEFVALVGPNGHGKTTLLKSICGLVRPSRGSVRYEGEEIGSLPTHRIVEKGVTYIAEDRHLFPDMTVLENLRLGSYNRSARKDEGANLDYVFSIFPKLKGMTKRLAGNLSGGEARMLAMGRGLMSNANFLAIDEPSLGLAPNLRSDVVGKIAEINERGITVLLVEQSTYEIANLANRIYLLEEGEITFEGDRKTALDNDRLREAFLGC